MTNIEQKIADNLNKAFDKFVQEKTGMFIINMMPPKDKVPAIKKIFYNKEVDTFEIFLANINDQYSGEKKGVEFSKDDNGHLVAMYIKYFSNLHDKENKKYINYIIDKEIKKVSKNINIRQDIINYVVDKRILIFLKELVNRFYRELIRAYVKDDQYKRGAMTPIKIAKRN